MGVLAEKATERGGFGFRLSGQGKKGFGFGLRIRGKVRRGLGSDGFGVR